MSDIIAAYATAPGSAGLSVLRISGDGAAELADRIFSFGPLPMLRKKKSKIKKTVVAMQAYQAAFGYVHKLDDKNDAIDQCVLLRYVAPKSYTGEEQVEISIHGGASLRKQVLQEVLKAGANPAQAGEFSKRAFLNGKMDLTQAESVMDLIQADTKRQQEAALEQMQGKVGNYIRELREDLYQLLGALEVDIEYPEYEDFHYSKQQAEDALTRIKNSLQNVLQGNEQGHILRDGLRVVLLGEPNVGKSSLLNVLAGEERAIVTEIPGTTRDAIELRLELAGLPVFIYDTAGIRESDDIVEQMGVKRSLQHKTDAHLLLAVVPATENDRVLEILDDIVHDSTKDFLVLCNKIDLLSSTDELDCIENNVKQKYPNCLAVLNLSAKEEQGIDALRQEIAKYYESLNSNSSGDVVLTSLRQQKIVQDGYDLVTQLIADLEFVPVDVLLAGLHELLELLGEITGEDVSEQMVEEIFARFCIGK